MIGVEIAGMAVLLVNVADQVAAFEDACAHQRRRLSEGRLEGGVLTCAAHHWEFEAASGCGINPRSARLRRFPVKLENGDILVDVEAPVEIERDAG
jgi:toluene monooxygenase system ferredoxin subunit